jgi:outer membrane receptor for ferrienterochelin and colicin
LGATIHYTGQYWDNRFYTSNFNDRKVREWTTVDLVLTYTFDSPAAAAPDPVAGYTKTSGSAAKGNGPVSTAEYNPCGWRAWLKNTTLTVGVNNVCDLAPPFVAAATNNSSGSENGFDEVTANAKGRFWYVALKKRF